MDTGLCSKCKTSPKAVFKGGRVHGWCVECRADYMRSYHACLPKRKTWLNNVAHGWRNKKKLYGISKTEYEALKERQGNLCAICKKPETRKQNGKVIALAVDHNHQNGLVRGLLCRADNVAIGQMQEDIGRLEAAIAYIKLHME